MMRSFQPADVAERPWLTSVHRTVSAPPADTDACSMRRPCTSRSGAEAIVTAALLLVSALPSSLLSRRAPSMSLVMRNSKRPVPTTPAGQVKAALRSREPLADAPSTAGS